jgi:5'-nucleotidase
MKILYFDMDNVLVDFQSAFKHLSEDTLKEYEGSVIPPESSRGFK